MEKRGTRDKRIVCLEDLMPTLLDFCGLPIPESVEGISLTGDQQRPYLYGEISEGEKATRMIRMADYKLIYYPYGNVSQLFCVTEDPEERYDLAGLEEYRRVQEQMEQLLMTELYGEDRHWIEDGKLRGEPCPEYREPADYGFSNQR